MSATPPVASRLALVGRETHPRPYRTDHCSGRNLSWAFSRRVAVDGCVFRSGDNRWLGACDTACLGVRLRWCVLAFGVVFGVDHYQSPLFLPASEIFLATDPDCFRRPRLDPCLDRLWPGSDRAVVFLRSPPIAILVNGTRCTGAASSCPWSSLPRYVGLTGRVADSSFLPPAGAG